MKMERRGSNASSVSQREEISSLPFFHASFKSTEDVADYVRRKSFGRPGSFLLRPSNRRRSLLTVSVLVPDHSVRHTHVTIEENGSTRKYFLVVEKKFNSVQELVDYYGKNPVRNLEGVEDVFFKHPLNRDVSVSRDNSLRYAPSVSGGSVDLPAVKPSLPPRNNLPSRTSSNSISSEHSLPSPQNENVGFIGSPNGSPTTGMGARDGAWGGTSHFAPDPLAHRPPLPLPPGVEPNKTDYATGTYSRARNVDEDISDRLKDALRQSERCECGIPRELSELPRGWTVHKSKDPPTYGKLFYQSAEGLTAWTLPEEIRMQLTQKHIVNLKKLSYKSATSASMENLQRPELTLARNRNRSTSQFH